MDNFSNQSNEYSSIRPSYPESLFKYIASQTKGNFFALDIGTGNGQCAVGLSKYYKNVIGIDKSTKQIDQAGHKDNVKYYAVSAEQAFELIDDKDVDLITFAQSLHFFDLSKIYPCIKRVLKPDGMFVAWSYIYPECCESVEINIILSTCYYKILKNFWEPFRSLVNERYKTIKNDLSPDESFSLPDDAKFVIKKWTLDDLWKYMNTWTAVQYAIKLTGDSPIDPFYEKLNDVWEDPKSVKTFKFELYFIHGRNL
jgi:ubiquinone/menaquinone biosynthesis C-methylase UbiE